jgi:ABC-type amino acid transport substrate-binding protein
MKKLISFSLALMLLLGVLAVPALAETKTCGVLSYLNLSEEDDARLSLVRRPFLRLLFMHGVLTGDNEWLTEGASEYKFFDTLNDMTMALQGGTVDAIKVPYYTGLYLSNTNDKMKLTREYHPEKANEISEWALSRLSDGYSFMMKEENAELRDAFDAQLAAMKEDGTLQKLIDEHIIKVAEGGEPVAVDFEQFEGDPIKVGVTGSLPPMDYKSADDSFAGFNTAVLAEIGRRLQKNIELVQVDSIGRSLALAEGTVDVVFWTRALSESIAERRRTGTPPSEEERAAHRAERFEKMTEEERALFPEDGRPDDATKEMDEKRDMPPNTIITMPYFTDFPIWVVME